MHIPCKDIATHLKKILIQEVAALRIIGTTPRLLAVLIGDSQEQQSYVKIKQRTAHELGIEFVLWHQKEILSHEAFLLQLRERIDKLKPDGILIQQPLPPAYGITHTYLSIPVYMDIEGHVNQHYTFPLVQACALGLAWTYRRKTQLSPTIGLDFITLPYDLDTPTITWLQTKSIVIAGRGMTTGRPIAAYFDKKGITYTQTDSTTKDPAKIYAQADIIITGVGKHIIKPQMIKEGVTLLNFGLRELIIDGKPRLKGDYEEAEVGTIAAIYTQTPGGLGPIDVLCMYGNLIAAAKIRHLSP